MKFSEKSDYGFAVGRVRAKESLLIKRNEYERLASVKSEDELVSLLKPIWYLETPEREAKTFENLLTFARDDNTSFFLRYCTDSLVKELFPDITVLKTKQLISYLKNLNNEFLIRYFTVAIDLENIRSFIRVKNLAVREKQELPAMRGGSETTQKKLFSKNYLNAGSIEQSALSELLPESWDNIIHWSDKTPYKYCIERGINYLLEQKSFIRLERLIEEEKQKILIQARYAVFGYEPLVAYYLFKENEITNLRKIFYGITEYSPISQIRESIACIL